MKCCKYCFTINNLLSYHTKKGLYVTCNICVECKKRVTSESNPKFWKGKNRSEATKTKISKSKIGQEPWNKGLKHCFSNETRLKMSVTHTGVKLGDKHSFKNGKYTETFNSTQ